MPYVDELPSKAVIFDYWKDKLRAKGLFIDWGEPSCWACGFHYGTKFDIKRSDASWDEIFCGWNDMPLQRCHIVSRQLGGSDDPENLFLMCRECHNIAPNTDIPDIFFEWARAQSYVKRDAGRLDCAFSAFGIAEGEQAEIAELLSSHDFQAWSSDRVGIHRPQSNYPSRLFRLTAATMIGLAVHYRRSSKPPRTIEWE